MIRKINSMSSLFGTTTSLQELERDKKEKKKGTSAEVSTMTAELHAEELWKSTDRYIAGFTSPNEQYLATN